MEGGASRRASGKETKIEMVWKFAFNYEIKEGRGEKGRGAGESEEEGEPEEWELLREGGEP